MNKLPIIQKTYDLIKWYVPILNRLPRDHRFTLGERLIHNLYSFLEDLIRARFTKKERLSRLQEINIQLDIIRYQTRLLYDFDLMGESRYEYVSQKINEIGQDLGAWIKQNQKSLPS